MILHAFLLIPSQFRRASSDRPKDHCARRPTTGQGVAFTGGIVSPLTIV